VGSFNLDPDFDFSSRLRPCAGDPLPAPGSGHMPALVDLAGDWSPEQAVPYSCAWRREPFIVRSMSCAGLVSRRQRRSLARVLNTRPQ